MSACKSPSDRECDASEFVSFDPLIAEAWPLVRDGEEEECSCHCDDSSL